jgi:hypothetical protein
LGADQRWNIVYGKEVFEENFFAAQAIFFEKSLGSAPRNSPVHLSLQKRNGTAFAVPPVIIMQIIRLLQVSV